MRFQCLPALTGFVYLLCLTATAFPQGEAPSRPILDRIDEKAKQIQGCDPAIIGELVDLVMESHGVTPEVSMMAADFRTQVVTAECDYQAGKRPGVTESSIAAVIDSLAAGFKTPDFTFTTPSELHFLRQQMVRLHPNFTGIVPVSQRVPGQAYTLTSEMSPLEGLHVLATMIYQKVYVAEWQRTPAEWRARFEETQKSVNEGTPPKSERTKQVIDAIRSSFIRMSMRDIEMVIVKSFSDLGITQ